MLVSFLNANQGAIMALLTFVYVIATIIIVVFNKKTIDEMKVAREEESRPYVFAYFAFVARETKTCTLVVKNYGKTGARIDKFSISPSVSLIKGFNDCSFFKDTILAPGQSIRLLIIDEKNSMIDQEYRISIAYSSLSGSNSYSEEYDVVQQYAGEAGYTDSSRSNVSKAENALINISHSLDIIKTSLL